MFLVSGRRRSASAWSTQSVWVPDAAPCRHAASSRGSRARLLAAIVRAKHVAATRKHHKANPHRQIANKLRVRVGHALKNNGAGKAERTMELIG